MWHRSFLQVCPKALDSLGLTNASKRNEPSRNWMEQFPRAPLSQSLSSSLTILATITRPSHLSQHTWHLKHDVSADRFTTRRGASGTFHCHHYPGTWLSQLQFISNVFFTTSFFPFRSRYFPFRDFCLFIRYFYIFIFVEKLFRFSLVVYVTCVLQLFFKCPVCVERYDHLEELCTVARVSFVITL